MAAALFMGAVTAVAQSNPQPQLVQPLTIHGQYKGQTVLLTATRRSAGAIESLQWGGMEFLDASDHGRHLQSAISFDGLGECDNPTEAGASRDGSGPNRSSSRLLAASAAGNVLSTRSEMAYWLRKGQRSAECRAAMNDGSASRVSSTQLTKTVRFLPGAHNVIEHQISFDLARPRSLAVVEVLTAYMPDRFSVFYRFNPASTHLETLSDGPGEQELPVVLATSDGQHALGLYTPKTGDAGVNGPGYGRFRFDHAPVTKSNVVFRLQNATAGAHRFVVYTVFGTVDDVRLTLGKLYSKKLPNVAVGGPAPAIAEGGAAAELARN